MTNIVFSEKRTITSDFSPKEMMLIAQGRSPQEARKYFFTKYALPIALTHWYQQEGAAAAGDRCNIRIAPVPNGVRPIVLFESARHSLNLRLDAALVDDRTAAIKEQIFKICPPTLWNELGYSLEAAMYAAFGECLPETRPTTETLSSCPVVASISKKQDGVELTVLVKTRTTVRDASCLLNQADDLNSPLLIKVSEKYRKMYNTITGKWNGICAREDPDVCEPCRAIYASPAAENVYNDPDFR